MDDQDYLFVEHPTAQIKSCFLQLKKLLHVPAPKRKKEKKLFPRGTSPSPSPPNHNTCSLHPPKPHAHASPNCSPLVLPDFAGPTDPQNNVFVPSNVPNVVVLGYFWAKRGSIGGFF